MYRIVGFILIPCALAATKYAGEFQELKVGSRSCAMGGTGVAQFLDPATIYFNPAGSYYVKRGVLLMHAENFAGIVRNEFGAIVLRRGAMSIGFGLQYLSVSGIKLTTLNDTMNPPGSENPPVPYDTVGTSDVVFYINGARGNDRVSYGVNLKIFYRDLSVMTGYGGGVDFGLALNLDLLKIGFGLRDVVLSPLVWDNGTKERIMSKLSFGVAPVIPLEKISSVITLECDFTKQVDIEGFNINMGLEYAYKDILFGRFGIHNSNYTFGVGLKYKQLYLDYAFVTHSELKNSNKVSAGYTF